MMRARDYAAEFAGTFLVLLIGLSAVVVDFAHTSPVPGWIPDENVRRLLTGIFFAGGATAIVYSPLGRQSGGHINPAVTLAFLRLGKIVPTSAAGYMIAQFTGALAGAATVRVLWGRLAEQVELGTTIPGIGGWPLSFLAEILITFLLLTLILLSWTSVGSSPTRPPPQEHSSPSSSSSKPRSPGRASILPEASGRPFSPLDSPPSGSISSRRRSVRCSRWPSTAFPGRP